MRNYFLVQKKIGRKNSAHARFKDVTDSLHRNFSPLTSF